MVLLDELDFLVTRKQDVLYNLFDWPQRKYARLVVVGISNTLDLPDRLTARVQSRLGLQRLFFVPYNVPQIVQIVNARLHSLMLPPANTQNVAVASAPASASSSASSSSAPAASSSQSGAAVAVMESSAIELAARRVAALSGDVRKALQICR